MEPTAIGLVSPNPNSETHMTAICDVRLIYGRGWISGVFICCAVLMKVNDILSGKPTEESGKNDISFVCIFGDASQMYDIYYAVI